MARFVEGDIWRSKTKKYYSGRHYLIVEVKHIPYKKYMCYGLTVLDLTTGRQTYIVADSRDYQQHLERMEHDVEPLP